MCRELRPVQDPVSEQSQAQTLFLPDIIISTEDLKEKQNDGESRLFRWKRRLWQRLFRGASEFKVRNLRW